jgi:uncharacterized protein (UPF0332 family)
METATVPLTSSEFDIRNALSRAYYGVFHAARACLLIGGVALEKSRRHDWLQKLIGRERGAEFRRRIQELYALREWADYRPQMLEGIGPDTELPKLRVFAEAKVTQARVEFDWYSAQARSASRG